MPTVFSKQLATHFKRTDNIDLKGPLTAYIRATYSASDAGNAEADLLTIQRLRNEVAQAHSNEGAQGMRDSLTKYFQCLAFIETRIPISRERGQVAVSFTWYEAFRPAKKTTQANIHFEKAGVLFNLAAAIAQDALASDRTSIDGLVRAAKLFQEAAGVFVVLREEEASKVDLPRPADLTPEALSVMEKLMLTQAQECMYHNARMDNKSPALLARVAKQTQVMYEEVARAFATAPLSAVFDRQWAAHNTLKAVIYDVEMLVQVSRGLASEEKVAVEVAVLREAFQRLQAAKKLARGESRDVVDSVQRVQEAITQALLKAEKDNNTLYLQRVPAFKDAGISVEAASLVQVNKPNALASDFVPDNRLPFSRLVPEASSRALARYTAMVEDVVQSLMDKMAKASDSASSKLRDLELPETLEALDPRSCSNYPAACLPDTLLAELYDIQSTGGVSYLKGILSEISDVRMEVDRELAAALDVLDRDAQEDVDKRTKFGEAWRMPPAPPAAKEHVMQLKRSMAQAGDSDRGVLQRLADHELAFRRLDIDTAAMSMPRLQPPRHAVGPEEPGQVAASLRRDLDALQGLERERAELQASLQALKDRDNILPHLLATSPQGLDRLYISELKKYEPLSFAIERNSSNQADLMARLDRDNRLFHLTFDIQGWHQQCQAASQDLRQEVGVFKDLLEHCAEGLRFYLGMAEVARRCRQECEDAAASRRMDREELARALSRNSRQAEDDVLARRLAMANLGGGQAKYPAASAAYPSSAPPDAPGDSHQRKGGGLFGALLGLVTGGGGGQKQEAQQQPGYYPTAPYYQAPTEQEQRPSYRATFQYSYT